MSRHRLDKPNKRSFVIGGVIPNSAGSALTFFSRDCEVRASQHLFQTRKDAALHGRTRNELLIRAHRSTRTLPALKLALISTLRKIHSATSESGFRVSGLRLSSGGHFSDFRSFNPRVPFRALQPKG